MSSYQLGQYNWATGIDNNTFMELLTPNATAIRVKGLNDYNVTSSNNQSIFEDEAIYLGSDILKAGYNYYFHGKIKRLKNAQKFTVKLVSVIAETGSDGNGTTYTIDSKATYTEQYITQLVVAPGDLSYDSKSTDHIEDNWVDFEFVFSPIVDFNAIFFELERNTDDFQNNRYPKIAYEELSEIKNALTSIIGDNNNSNIKKNIIKIGIQSKPGFLMCINGEAIRTSRSGIYEIKNGIITVTYFSTCAPCEEIDTEIRGNFDSNIPPDQADPPYNMREWMHYVNIKMNDLEENPTLMESVYSAQFLNFRPEGSEEPEKKPRTINGFTMDYLYYEFTN